MTNEVTELNRDWRRSGDCLASIAKAFSGRTPADQQKILLNFAAQGKVAGRCAIGEIRIAVGDHAPVADWDIPQIENVSGQEIAPIIWEAIRKSESGCARVDLVAGTVVGSEIDAADGTLHRITIKLEDIQFDSAALDKHLDISRPALSNDETTATLKKGGGRPRNDTWNDWIAYLVLSIHDGEVSFDSTVSDALQTIADRMAADGLDEMPRSTVYKATARTLDLLQKTK